MPFLRCRVANASHGDERKCDTANQSICSWSTALSHFFFTKCVARNRCDSTKWRLATRLIAIKCANNSLDEQETWRTHRPGDSRTKPYFNLSLKVEWKALRKRRNSSQRHERMSGQTIYFFYGLLDAPWRVLRSDYLHSELIFSFLRVVNGKIASCIPMPFARLRRWQPMHEWQIHATRDTNAIPGHNALRRIQI